KRQGQPGASYQDLFERGRHHATVCGHQDNPLGPNDLAVDTLEGKALPAVIGRSHAYANRATRTDIRLRERRLPVFREHPLHDMLWLGVGLPRAFAARAV